MGRKNKSYSKDLHQQAYEKLTSMCCFSQSKKEIIKLASTKYEANLLIKDKIFTNSTYKAYIKHTDHFLEYIKEHYPEATTLKAAKKYMKEWLDGEVERGLSAWTIQLEAKALGKLYGILEDDPEYYAAPKRYRKDIKRSRGDRVRDKHFSKTNNAEQIYFCQGTGCRLRELKALKNDCLYTRDQIEAEIHALELFPDQNPANLKKLQLLKDTRVFTHGEDYFIFIRNGKGGRPRFTPIIGEHKQDIIDRITHTLDGKKVWEYVNENADTHGYRAEYATKLYKDYARDVDTITHTPCTIGDKTYKSAVYVCRNDERGKKLDREAMHTASKALGHNRISIIADNYLRGI